MIGSQERASRELEPLDLGIHGPICFPSSIVLSRSRPFTVSAERKLICSFRIRDSASSARSHLRGGPSRAFHRVRDESLCFW